MNFDHSDKVKALIEKLTAFMEAHVYPNEKVYSAQVRASGDKHFHPPIMEELKAKARSQGLWNLFLPDAQYGAGLTNLEYAPLAEIMGRSEMASEVFNCNAPDTGNMEILAEYGTEEQKRQWLQPLLDGDIRSVFSMTEPEVAGSDPTLLRGRAERKGDHYIINAHKWFSSNAAHPNAKIAIVMAVTNPNAPAHARASQILVPLDAPGVRIVRAIPVFNHDGGSGHCEVYYENVRVPATNLLGGEGDGFPIAQARLGPGRIHHCMRAIGGSERALDMMCHRAEHRFAHGTQLSDKGIIQTWIAESRMEIEQARLLVLYTAWKMDHYGKKEARHEISMIKTVVANMFQKVCDRAIQVHGALGTTNDVPLAHLWTYARYLRLADGPDEVHNMVVARRELKRVKALKSSSLAPLPPIPA
ncbi:MAG: acyl-CoA dehydrogenase family protein [Deltaproteobacteria bacterium]|nr:acyl-CoA dehydrogenase family protein [Deltaproteobacteria bacterium]